MTCVFCAVKYRFVSTCFWRDYSSTAGGKCKMQNAKSENEGAAFLSLTHRCAEMQNWGTRSLAFPSGEGGPR